MTRDHGVSPFRLLFLLWISINTLTLFLEGVQCQKTDNFYDLLEVPRQASKSEIKKAYRKLSMKYHPDKNPGDEQAAEYYKKINRAYEVLSNDDKRQMFDTGGED